MRMKLIGATLRRALFGVGLLATGRALLRHLLRADPEIHVRGPRPTGPHPFDTTFGVETGGVVSWRDLQAGGTNDPYISGYLGIAPSAARRVIGLIDNPAGYVFVDLGCGKGRAAIVASERPFRRVIGVEIAAGLAAKARENAAIIRANHPERPPIEIVYGDAADFALPLEPLVLFLYQPFEQPVMRSVLAQLASSLRQRPRPAIVMYIYPALARLIDRAPFLERMAEGVCELTEEERPYSYGGRGGSDGFVIWGTRTPQPVLALS